MKLNRNSILMSILSGVLLSFSFPNFIQNELTVYTSFFIWFAFIPYLYVVLKTDSIKSVIWYGFITGVVFYLIGFYWLWYVEPMGYFAYLAWVALAIYLAIWIAMPVALMKLLQKKYDISPILTFPVLLTLAEYVREWFLTGFPILTPAQSQFNVIFLLQILKITGVHGLNYMIFSVNIVLALIIVNKKITYKSRDFILQTSVIAFLFIMLVIANLSSSVTEAKLKVALLQSNIDQNVSWTSEFKTQSFDIYREMIGSVKNDNPDIFVWPETGYPGILNIDKDGGKIVSDMNKGSSAYHIVGSDKVIFDKGKPKYYNAAFAVSPKGVITGEYAKSHLVPFGEYVPLRDVFPFIRQVVSRAGFSGFEQGKTVEPLDTGDYKAGALICYDSLFPEISREFVKKGAQYLVHLSYETWYSQSPASAQIFTNTILRGVENNVDIARCVSAGISGIISKKGVIKSKTDFFTKTASIEYIEISKGKPGSFYTYFGDWFIALICVIILILIYVRFRKNANNNN